MIKFTKLLMVFSLLLSLPLGALNAAHHELGNGVQSNAPFSIQAQMCKLNEGVTIAQYDKLIEKYIKWSKKNDVETFFARQTPLFTHDTFNISSKYDFVEFLAAPFEKQGEGWDLWLGTKEGQKLNEEWQSLATCHVKMGSANFVYANEEALNKGNTRYAQWNWCSVKDGRKAEELMAFHKNVSDSMAGNTDAIGWLTFVPQLGGSHVPEFAHVMLYPNVESVMKNGKRLAEGGWKRLREYETEYANCSGSMLMIENVMNRPE